MSLSVTKQSLPKTCNIWVVMPAYNEAAVISETIRQVKELKYSLVVVDDRSLDDTPNLVIEQYDVHLCRHCVNLGQGAALQTGIDYALKHGAEYIVTFDADGQHNPIFIETLIYPLVIGQADVALASRFMANARAINIPPLRKKFLKLAVIYTRLVTGLELTDTHNGLRALSREAAQVIQLTQNRMGHASQILKIIANKKLRFQEIPVDIIYTSYSLKKGQKLSNAFNIFWDTLMNGLGI